MAYSVSSAFIFESRTKSPTALRRFTIGGSDYSSRVTKWPKFKYTWDDIRPTKMTATLANGDGALNFIREEKTNMRNNCSLDFGFNISQSEYDPFEPWDIAGTVYVGDNFTIPRFADANGVYMNNAGTLLSYSPKTDDTIVQYNINTPFVLESIDTSTYAYVWDVSTTSGNINFTFGNSETNLYNVDISAGRVYQYYLPVAGVLSVVSYTGNFLQLSSYSTYPIAMQVKPDGTKFFVLDQSSGIIHQYSMITSHDLSTGSYDSISYSVFSLESKPSGLFVSSGGEHMYIVGSADTILQFDLSSAWALDSTITAVGSAYLNTSNGASTADPIGLCFDPEGNTFYTSYYGDFDIRQYHIKNKYRQSGEYISLFSGEIGEVKYYDEKCQIKVIDKFQQLSDRQVGTSDVPVSYTGSSYLPSDIAWWVITSYGGYSNVQSTSNPDIDYTAFQDWSAVFSGDSVFVGAEFDGQKCTEILRKISRSTHSAIFIKENKISFHRFNIVDTTVYSFGAAHIKDLALDFNTDDITNRQYVSGDYTPSSDQYGFTVFDQSTSSVNSFGLRENQIRDDNLWYVDSQSAINLAQRLITTNAVPDDSLEVVVPLVGINILVGETVYISDDFHSLQGAYRVLSHQVDTDEGAVTLIADRTMISNAFILDVTSLNGSEILI